ncbi:hypothetical protein K3495_g12299 [Podosphaera aphanis]|nr:hypothetical protein K3495_g12299 [Podosphaera aphanis]
MFRSKKHARVSENFTTEAQSQKLMSRKKSHLLSGFIASAVDLAITLILFADKKYLSDKRNLGKAESSSSRSIDHDLQEHDSVSSIMLNHDDPTDRRDTTTPSFPLESPLQVHERLSTSSVSLQESNDGDEVVTFLSDNTSSEPVPVPEDVPQDAPEGATLSLIDTHASEPRWVPIMTLSGPLHYLANPPDTLIPYLNSINDFTSHYQEWEQAEDKYIRAVWEEMHFVGPTRTKKAKKARSRWSPDLSLMRLEEVAIHLPRL